MANSEYIEIRGPRSLGEVTSILGVSEGTTRVADSAVTVQFDGGDDYPYMVSVEAKSDAEQRVTATRLYRLLVSGSTWELLFTSDNAAGVIDKREVSNEST